MNYDSQFSWAQKDFQANNEEVPDCLIEDDFHTEGELMSREDIDAWLTDSAVTFCLIRQSDPTRFERLYAEYEADIDYLATLGKLAPDEVAALKNRDLFKFEAQE